MAHTGSPAAVQPEPPPSGWEKLSARNHGAFDISWELAQILTHQRSFFLHYNEHDRNFEMYCWATVHDLESQLWRVNVHEKFRFQLLNRVLHSSFIDGTAHIIGYRLVLPGQNTNRGLYRLPKCTPATLCDDIVASYQQLQIINGIHYATLIGHSIPFLNPPTVAPIINTNSMLLQSVSDHNFFPMQPGPRVNQGHLAPVLAGIGAAQFMSGQHDQVPAVPCPAIPGPATSVEAGKMTFNEVKMQMDVGDTIPTTDEIKAFTTAFRKDGPGKGAGVIICLHCPPGSERRRITTDLRPWNLTRHLLIDFDIKDFHCNKCDPPRRFTLKKQLENHLARHHRTGSNSGDQAAHPSSSQ
ncbi:hypothetical protein RSOLAG22IIIB_05645 [Rhizoctonia solani]|uniref:C2H2-type domain-containing protein n=1 Tax=Rhizoctonia solani TaxID=456999 RepID=A0A0K6G7N6_9AGAM|nr:hypothetical protein RSOLAG22IIIB_05645 [Rhizoctonia solani]